MIVGELVVGRPHNPGVGASASRVYCRRETKRKCLSIAEYEGRPGKCTSTINESRQTDREREQSEK